MPHKREPQYAEVWWIDHASFGGDDWQDTKAMMEVANADMPIVLSCGFVFSEDRQQITLAGSVLWGPDENPEMAAHFMQIAKKMIIKRVNHTVRPPK